MWRRKSADRRRSTGLLYIVACKIYWPRATFLITLTSAKQLLKHAESDATHAAEIEQWAKQHVPLCVLGFLRKKKKKKKKKVSWWRAWRTPTDVERIQTFKYALLLARPGEVVAPYSSWHEPSPSISTKQVPWDDETIMGQQDELPAYQAYRSRRLPDEIGQGDGGVTSIIVLLFWSSLLLCGRCCIYSLLGQQWRGFTSWKLQITTSKIKLYNRLFGGLCYTPLYLIRMSSAIYPHSTNNSLYFAIFYWLNSE